MWLPSLFRPRASVPPRRERFRPGVERLEDRTVPAMFNVTTPVDVVDASDGVLSLREAILEANTSPNADTIILPAGTYKLTRAGAGEDEALTGDLDITDHLTISGAGAGATIVDANFLDRAFHVLGGTVTISGVTIQHGIAGAGGGILNYGTLTVRDSTLCGNFASEGGGIYTFGTATVTNSTLCGNSANTVGGGIFNSGTL
ncbi:MAG TPA: CSLREA domain-containing protein, partial [Gemmataceae bacterium]|nr:CSLREA domain-containing protein [Gemmataceae bacterium]